MEKVPVISIDNPAPQIPGTWWAETNLGMSASSPCRDVTRIIRLSAPSEVLFQQEDTSACDGCVSRITAREPKEGVDAQFEIGRAKYRGKCPHIGAERPGP